MTISFGAAIQHDQIQEGSNVSFECHVAGNPSVGEIGWVFENRLLTRGANDHSAHNDFAANNVHVHENTLMIHNVNRRHIGRYRCVAANSQGEGRSEEILLKVQCKWDIPACSDCKFVGTLKDESMTIPSSLGRYACV